MTNDVHVISSTFSGVGAASVFAFNMSAAGSSATTNIMSGFGTASPTATVITPNLTGIVEAHFSGGLQLSSAVNTGYVQIYAGSGTPPNSGVAVTGSAYGSALILRVPAVALNTAFHRVAIVSGLTIGTAYWFDIAYKTSAAADLISLSEVDATIKELLW
jgi:hypothetical protein